MKTSYAKTWGTSQRAYEYNKKHHLSNNAHFQNMELGPEIESLKSCTSNNNNNNDSTIDNTVDNKENTTTDINTKQDKEETDTVMVDNEVDDQNKNDSQIDEETQANNISNTPMITTSNNTTYNELVLNLLSTHLNINQSQIDLVLNFFNTARAEQKRIEKQEIEILKKIQFEQQSKEQRMAGALTLSNIIPFLTINQCEILMEMKTDNIESATNYGLTTEPTILYFELNEWKKKHQKQSSFAASASTYDPFSSRSELNKRVLVRNQRTGIEKSVIFRCTDISDDGEITLKGILDRNSIPLDPTHAKTMRIPIRDFMSIEDSVLIDSETIAANTISRILCIVFQVIGGPKPITHLDEQTMNELIQNVQIPEEMIASGDFIRIQNYAKQFVLDQQQAAVQMTSREKMEFSPISFAPQVRDLEYKLEFDSSSSASNACLKSVQHRIDGHVLFRGIMDTGENVLIGNTMVEVYSQILDDVTHNIVCIIIDNHLPMDFMIDVLNISFTDTTLVSAIKDSEREFDKSDMMGKKLSYKIIVECKKIVAILTKIGNEIKELPFIEHIVPSVGSLVCVPKRNVWGIVRCIPTGLIVTNDPNKNIVCVMSEYKRNVHSTIVRKHWVSDTCEGFIDIDVVRDGYESEWVDVKYAGKQAFAVCDILSASDDDIIAYMTFKEINENMISEEIKNIVIEIEKDMLLLKNKNFGGDRSAVQVLNDCTGRVKDMQEKIASFKQRKMSSEEEEFVENMNKKMSEFNREIRALRYEVRMM